MNNNKNELFKEYLTTELHESELIVKLDGIQDKSVKQDGVIYTPWSVVSEMVRLSNPTLEMTIIEPSCGHGIFFFGILNHIRESNEIIGQDLLDWFLSNVYGVDIVENTILETKEILSAYFKKHFGLEVEPTSFKNIIVADGLFHDFGVDFDLCIGNPPYIRTKNLDNDYLKKIRQSFNSCKKGNVDIYYAFVERFSIIANELCFITPNGFLNNVSGKPLKELIQDSLSVLIDFKEKLVFKDARTYTCIFKTLRDTNIKQMLYANDISADYPLVSKDSIFGEANEDDGLLSKVLSGVATLCDSVYIVKKHKDGNFYASHNGAIYQIEEGVVVPYLKITKLKTDELSNIDYMIYPYNEDKSIIKEEDLKKEFPLAHTYLLAMKERLLQRDKGKTGKYESWYAYGRKQGLHTITEEFVVIVPQMIGGECKPHKINISNLLNRFGKIVFTSGFVVPQTPDNNVACDYILSQNFIEFAKKNGKAWPGKDEAYYSLTAKQIKKFKV